MSEEYVRKDVYDANMAEIRALMAASEARHEAIATRIEGRLNTLEAKVEGFADTFSVAINNINGRIDDVHLRIDDMNAKQGRSLNLMTLAITIAGVLIAAVQLFIAFFGK